MNHFQLCFQHFVVAHRIENRQRSGNFFPEQLQTFYLIYQNCPHCLHFLAIIPKFFWVNGFIRSSCFVLSIVYYVDAQRSIRCCQIPSVITRDYFIFTYFDSFVDSIIFARRFIRWWTAYVYWGSMFKFCISEF